ncbi:condensation domain-containing protein [Leptolyngbya boryana CZ1]|uniref:Condensation domain-containing protein n=1 Tax=Leptolyngbya boryana CZ1 TaxID=3060204 RepID=A0AA96X1F5_LEPBY|nr:condensation domain-containing protein [Leptolyngbya boryana]WNZ48079.1 condensation domain-containing protein [Leptolyngbya boryana CZ1]
MPSAYRRLGALEQLLWLRDRVIPFHFAITAQVRGTIDSAALTYALEQLQQRHPLLRVKISLEQKSSPHFVEHSSAIPYRMIARSGETHWQTEAARELTEPFDWAEAPLIRIVWLYSPEISDLIVVCHHAIADGMTTVKLIQEILSLLACPQQAVLNHSVPPSLESLLPDHQPISHFQKVLATGMVYWQQFWQRMKPRQNDSLCENSSLQVSAGQFSPEITTQLIQYCRQEATTVHAAICAAWLLTIAQHCDSKQLLHCLSPINLRPYFANLPECGLYISSGRTAYTITHQTQFWQLARSLNLDLMQQAKNVQQSVQQLVQQHTALICANPSPEFVNHLFRKQYASDVMVTNLGRLSIPQQYGNLFLSAIYGPIVLSGFEQERVCGVATLNDRLFFTIVHHTSEAMLVKQAMQLLETVILHPDTARFTVESLRIENGHLTQTAHALKH